MKCWYCGKNTMSDCPELGKGWFLCSSCGATWIDVIQPYQAVAEEVIKRPNGTKTKHIKARLTGREKHATSNSNTSRKAN